MLVLIGATPEGKKELVGFQTGRITPSVEKWELRTPPRYAASTLHAVTNFRE